MADASPHAPRTVDPIDATSQLVESFDHTRVTELRHTVAAHARTLGLADQRLEDFVLAVNELTTNAVRHGGGRGRLRLWCAGETVICEVSDHGGGISGEQLSDQRRPASDTTGGWGLWLARRLSDDMSVRTGPAGTTVRVSATIPAGGGGVGVTATEPQALETRR